MSTEHKLDLYGLRCPITSIRLKRYLKKIKEGHVIVQTDDNGDSNVDISIVAERCGYKIVHSAADGVKNVYRLEKADV